MECAVKRVIISNDAHSSIGQRKWEFTPKSERVIDSCYLGSKKMTNLLRHRLELRESDDAVAWEKLLMHLTFLGNTNDWSTHQWTHCSRKSAKKDTIRVLPEFARQNSIRGSSSRPFWRSQSRFNTAKQRGNSLRMDRLNLSRWILR